MQWPGTFEFGFARELVLLSELVIAMVVGRRHVRGTFAALDEVRTCPGPDTEITETGRGVILCALDFCLPWLRGCKL